VTTHVGLTARAFGAEGVFIAAQDRGVVTSIRDVVERFGGTFFVEDGVSWRSCIRTWKDEGGTVVHLTMYGLPSLKSSPRCVRQCVSSSWWVPRRCQGSLRSRGLQHLGHEPAALRDRKPRSLPRSSLRGRRVQPRVPWGMHPRHPDRVRETNGGDVIHRVLIAGFSTRHVAQSACHAGCRVDRSCYN